MEGTSKLLYILVIIYTMSGFTDIDAVWAEMPILVQRLPEYWELPSYFTIIIALAAVSTIVYSGVHRCKPDVVNEVSVQYGLNATSIFCFILLTVYWRSTVEIDGKTHSVIFLMILSLLSLKTQLAPVVLLPYLSRFPSTYISAFFIGDGLCGVVPSFVSLIQGAGEYKCVNISLGYNRTNFSSSFIHQSAVSEKQQVMLPPVFSVELFFIVITVVLVLSAVSFLLLHHHPWCKKFHAEADDTKPDSVRKSVPIDTADSSFELFASDIAIQSQEHVPLQLLTTENRTPKIEEHCEQSIVTTSRLSNTDRLFLLFQFGLSYGVNYGLVYPVQSFSLLPYGNLAYSLGNRLATVALSGGGLLGFFFPTRSTKVITTHFVIGFLASVFVMVLAVLSPNPPLKGSVIGTIVSVSPWIVLSVAFGYNRVGIATVLKESGGKNQLMYAGVANVVATFILSVLMFVLINIFHVFEDIPPCS